MDPALTGQLAILGLVLLAILAAVWMVLRTWLDFRLRSTAPAADSSAADTANQAAESESHADTGDGMDAAIDMLQLDHTVADLSDETHTTWRPDAIMVLDADLRLKWANRTAEKWFRLELARDQDQAITDLIVEDSLRSYLGSGRFERMFDCQAPGDSKIVIRIRVTPYHHDQHLLQARDISQIKALELVRRDFVANASHELRTPVSVLYGYLEMMMQKDARGISKEWRPAITQMHEQTARIKKIIEDMLLLSRLEETETLSAHEHIDIHLLLESAMRDAAVISGNRKHDIRLEADRDYSLLCNHEEIESLVSNLVSNAVRYTPEGGSITLGWRVDANGGHFSVRDTGIGIAPEDLPRVTERFYRSDPARSRVTGGTGLGLAIVNHISNRHQARLDIVSELHQGSTFTVTFPASRVRKERGQVELLLG